MRTIVQQPVYDSTSRSPAALRELVELVRYRELLRLLIIENLKQRYERSILGVVWTFLNPLLSMTVLALAFSSLFRSAVANYPAYVLVGLIGWTCFAQTSSQTIDSVVHGNQLLKRIYLPRTIFSVAAVGSGMINLGMSMIPLAGIMLITHYPITATWMLVPLAMVLLAMFTLGFGMLVAAFAIHFADVGYLYQIIIQAWFFLTPVMYPVTIIPPAIQVWLRFNPMSPFISLLRALLYEGRVPTLVEWATTLPIASIMLAGGWFVYTSQSDQLTYRS